MTTLRPVLALLFAGCRAPSEEGDTGDTLHNITQDDDGDGHTEPDDCDEGSASIHPDATEVCNGVDDNCDGQVDEGVTTTFYADTDGDGLGDPNATLEACDAPEGYTAVGSDCDDSNPNNTVPVDETCNGVDDDCDGEVDEEVTTTYFADADGDGLGDDAAPIEACEPPVGFVPFGGDCDDASPTTGLPQTWCIDADGDSFGDASNEVTACEPPQGATLECSDCDDTNSSNRPGGTEYCDSIDNNCDGSVDEGSAVDAQSWYADLDEDGFGDGRNTLEACAQPEGYLDDAEDCDDAAAGVNPAGVEVCNDGVDDDCDGNADDVDADADGFVAEACGGDDCDDELDVVRPTASETCDNGMDDDCDGTDNGCLITGQLTWADTGRGRTLPNGAANSGCGAELRGRYDVNGDGVSDYLSRCTYWSGSSVFYGPDSSEAQQPGYLWGKGGSNWAGAGVSGMDAGDLTGDGIADVALAWGYGATSESEVVVYESAPTGSRKRSTAPLQFWVPSGGPPSVAVGDFTGDGQADLVMGLRSRTGSELESGQVLLFAGPLSTPSLDGVTDATVRIAGTQANGWLGDRAWNAGDIDADGSDDLLVAATQSRAGGVGGGALHLFLGPLDGDLTDAEADLTLVGGTGDRLRIADAGFDSNGDGHNELLVGSFEGESGRKGAVYLLAGPLTDHADLSTAAAVFRGPQDGAPAAVGTYLGDLNGDGEGDFAFAAPDFVESGEHVGRVWIVYGPVAGDLTESDADAILRGSIGSNGGDRLGTSIAGIGDVDLDGFDDFVLGRHDVLSRDNVTDHEPWNRRSRDGGLRGGVFVVLGSAGL